MVDTQAPPKPGGSRTFRLAMWNVVDGNGGRLKQAATGLAQMGVDVAVLTETKLVDGKHPKVASWCTIMCSKAANKKQGGVTLLWKVKDSRFGVESVSFNNGPNIVTFQLVTGHLRYHVIGVYIPPNSMTEVDNIRKAWGECP